MIDYEKMMTHVKSHPYPLVFATISEASTLPDMPSGRAALSDLLVRLRLADT